MQRLLTEIIDGDAKHELRSLEPDSVDLIITSPPYADSRKDTYGVDLPRFGGGVRIFVQGI